MQSYLAFGDDEEKMCIRDRDRRMQDMMKMYGMSGMDPAMFGSTGQTLILNANNSLVQYVLNNKDGENTDIICKQLYDLALISHAPLTGNQMTEFIARSNNCCLLYTSE